MAFGLVIDCRLWLRFCSQE